MQTVESISLFRTAQQPAMRVPVRAANDAGADDLADDEVGKQPPATIPAASIPLNGQKRAWLPRELWQEGIDSFDEAWAYWQAVQASYSARLGRTIHGYYVVGLTP